MQSTKGHPSIFAGQFQTESVWIFWENSAECAFKTCYYWGSHVLTSLLEVSGTLVAWSMSIDFRTLGVPFPHWSFANSTGPRWPSLSRNDCATTSTCCLRLSFTTYHRIHDHEPSDTYTTWRFSWEETGMSCLSCKPFFRSEDALNIE